MFVIVNNKKMFSNNIILPEKTILACAFLFLMPQAQFLHQ